MLHDVMTSLRRAVRTPVLSLTLVGILGTGIGATATMVSVLDTMLWRPVAMPQPNELVEMTTLLPDGERRAVPLLAAERVTQAALPVQAWCAYSGPKVATRVSGRFMQANSAVMSAGCVEVMRVTPAMGRWFTAAEAPAAGRGRALAVITDRYWKRMFNAAPDVIGRTVSLDEGILTVVGVLPPSFEGFDKDTATDIIMPFGVFEPSTASWSLIGRLRPGASLDALRAQLTAVWPGIIKDTATSAPDPAEAVRLQVQLQSAAAGFSLLGRLYAPALSIVTTLAVLLLLLTCVNASRLLATKVASYRDEMLVMRALGATGWRIIRQVLAE